MQFPPSLRKHAASSNRHQACLRAAGATLLALLLLPSTALASWWSHDWSYRKQIVVDTSAKGANVTTDLKNATVLLRLHEGIFKFDDANPDGSDLRFVSDDDKTPLKFHVEKFDPVFNLAFVWVQVPELKAGAATKIWMYYGNAKTVAEGDPRETYDSDQVLVYHFGERGAPAADATGYHNTATSSYSLDESGLIGNAAKFDGQAVLGLPASPSLAVAAGGQLTWSAWVKPTAADEDGVIYTQQDSGRSLVIGLSKGAPYVAITDAPGSVHESPAAEPLGGTGWHHLAMIAGSQVTLYVDGHAGPSLAMSLPALAAAPVLAGIGGGGAPVTGGFRGEVDELEISKVERDPALIALYAGNQGTNDKLVQFGGDEAISTWSSGYVGIILHSVTLDGWVIIGILMVMAVISWLVMWTKAGQINQAARANRMFLKMFQSAGGDFGTLHQMVSGTSASAGEAAEKSLRLVRKAPLMRLFSSGVDELEQRLSGDLRGGKRRQSLATQSFVAIRAEIDSTMVVEVQSLNRLMVLLTIAISGGPFIGLLGTVVGVMITFAAVAAAGEVNVNAIAPGIAAALVATVAGLFVAIPALFGYNYLLTRIKEITAQMHVFVDAFIARMAENYRNTDVLGAMIEK
jgi:biopolymer transport protein ExbB